MSLTHIRLRIFILILSGAISAHSALAVDELTLPSHIGSLKMSLTSHERIPINALLARPDHYQMREIRITGTVTKMQTETITNRMVCGRAHEQTALTLEDDSGQVEVIDRGACGMNVGALRAPMLKVGQQIDLLVQIMISTGLGAPNPSLEATIRYIDLVQE